MVVVSEMDELFLTMGREHISRFFERTGARLANESGRLLDIGPQDRSELPGHFRNYTVETFDIVDTYKPTYVGDITRRNDRIPDSTFDCIACVDVLEHTQDPFGAMREIRRILKHGGFLLFGAPLNFRIHGPIPDCWRFTEHGLQVLLRGFEIMEMDILETPDRDLFPVRYNVLARNDKLDSADSADPADLKFRFIT